VFIASPDATPSLEPIPIPLWVPASPLPLIAFPPPLTLGPYPEEIDPVPMYLAEDLPPLPPTPSSIAFNIPIGPEPGVSPGPEWVHNISKNGIKYEMFIPDGDDGITLATFLRVNPNDRDA